MAAETSHRFNHTIEDMVLHEEGFYACERVIEHIMSDIELMVEEQSLQEEWLKSDYFLEQMLYLHRSVLKLLHTTHEAATFLPDDIFSLQELLYEVAQRLERILATQPIEEYKKLCFFIIIAEAQVILNFLTLHRSHSTLGFT